MSYRNYNTFGPSNYAPNYQQKFGYSNISRNYSSRNDDNAGELEFMLQNQRKKFKQAKEKHEYDLDNERKIRIEFENKLIRLKDQFSRKQVTISELQFRTNNLLQQNQDLAMQNQRHKAQLMRIQDVYSGKIRQLQTQLDMQARSLEQTTNQYNSQFDNFKRQGQQYVEQLTFQFQRKIKSIEQRIKSSQLSKRQLSLEVKKLNDILINNKLNFEQQIRDLKNRFRDEQMRKNSNINKSFEGKLKMIEQGKQILARKNMQLLKALQEKDRKIQQYDSQFKDEVGRVRHENAELIQQSNNLNYLIAKLKFQINEKDGILGRRVNDNQGQVGMLRNQLGSKRQQINRLSTMNKQLRINIKQIQNDQERKRRELAERCKMWEGQARKYKEEYTRICDVLKSKINDTINNVERRK